MMEMRNKWVLVPLGVVSVALVSGYALFGMSARHPLSRSKSPMFGSGLLPIAPSSILNKEKWSAAFGLARQTFTTSPISSDNLVVAGQRYDVPLPTNSFRNRDRDRSPFRSYITFATPEQLDAYYATILPEAGWTLSDRMGGARKYTKNTTQLLVTDSFYMGTRVTQLHLAIEEVGSRKTSQ